MQTVPIIPPEDKLKTTAEVVEWCAENDLPADLVGRWVWLKFPEKPDKAVRTAIKAAGFKWCKNRGEWAHSCGIPSRRGSRPPRFTYGAVPVASVAGQLREEVA